MGSGRRRGRSHEGHRATSGGRSPAVGRCRYGDRVNVDAGERGTTWSRCIRQSPAITAGGIIGPVLPSIAVNPIAIGLAIASGALFALHVNSNFFWMFKSLLGLSTTGALKSLTTVTTIASLVSLPVVVALGLVI